MFSSFWFRKWLVRTGLARFSPTARRLTGGHPHVVKYLSDRTLAAPVELLKDPALFPNVDGPDVMNLNLPAPRFDSPLSSSRMTAERSGLPAAWGTMTLREAIAHEYERTDRRRLEPRAEVVITHGATSAYSATLDAFVNPGDGVVLFDPSSPLFSLGAASRRANVRWVPTWNEDGRIRFPEENLERAMRGAKLLVMSDPASPNGGVLAAGELERIAWFARRHDVLVYIDGSFGRFRYDAPATPFEDWSGLRRRLLVSGSVSQGYGLASLRVGWVSGPAPLLQAVALQSCLNAPYVSTASQELAVRVLRSAEHETAPLLERFRERRRYTIDRLRGIGLEPAWPGGGYFTWLAVGRLGLDGRQFAEKLLREKDVLVGPGSFYGPSGAGHVRISFATEDGRLREGLSRLGAFVNELAGKGVANSAEPKHAEVVTALTY